MVNVYKSDLAYIHDDGFGHLARSAAPPLLELLQQGGKAGGLVVDLDCGSGIFARELFAAGHDVLGIDISESMIALARARVPRGEFHTGSYLTAKFPPCVAVTAIGECFNYLFDQRNTEQELLGLFHRIYDALQPGGFLMFDVATPGRVPSGSGSQRHHHEEEDWVVLVVRVPRMTGVFAVGRIINAKTARSQFIGGMTMGLSMALHEESMVDGRFGHVVNHDFAGYHIPTNADVGEIDVAWIDEHDPHVNPMGSKGIGEIGIVGSSAAVANAVHHATGVRVRDLPITPDKLLR